MICFGLFVYDIKDLFLNRELFNIGIIQRVLYMILPSGCTGKLEWGIGGLQIQDDKIKSAVNTKRA